MGENEYKIQLGVELDTSDIKSQISAAEAKLDPIEIKIDIETKQLVKQLESGLKALTSGSKNVLTSLEASLKDVSTTIKDIKTSLGTLDSKSGMKSLLSSINQISTALEKASNQFESLNTELKTLSSKDFSINVGVNMGSSNNPIARNAAYGNKVRGDTLPQLKQQISEFVKYYNNMYKESVDEIGALQKLVSGTKLNTGDFYQNFLLGKDSVFSRMSGGSLSSQMQAYKEYIDMFKEAAKLKGLDLSSITSSFSKSADELIKDAQDIQTGAKEMEDGFEKLKQVFGGGNNLNIEGISTQLDSIVIDLREIKTAIQGLSSGISLDGLTSSFDKLSNSIELLVQNCANMKTVINDGVSSGIGVKDIENDLKQVETSADNASNAIRKTADEARKLDNISIDISNGNIDDLKNSLKNLKVDDTSIENAIKELNEMNIVAKSVSGTLKDGNLVKWEIKGLQTTTDGLERAVTITKTLGKEGWASSEKYSQSLDKIAVTAEKVRAKLKDTGFDGFEAEVNRAHTEADKLKTSSLELQEALKRLDTTMDAINSADQANDIKRLAAANEEYEAALKQVYSQLKLNQQAEIDAYNTEKLNQAKKNFSLEIDNWLKNNSAAAKEFGAEIRNLQSRIDACDDKSLAGLRREFQAVKKEAQLAGKTTQTFGDKIKTQFSKYSAYLGVAEIFMYAEQGLRDMFEQVVAIDTAMTELKKVTDETNASYNEFLSNAASRSKEIGTTIDGLVTSTADFARLGYGFKDSQGLAEVANIYAVVGDEIDGVEGATQSLVSTMAAFKDEMNGMNDSDFAMSIVDKFNEVSNNFAISSGGIGEALQRSASSMAAANNTLDETIALITAANTVVNLCHAA